MNIFSLGSENKSRTNAYIKFIIFLVLVIAVAIFLGREIFVFFNKTPLQKYLTYNESFGIFLHSYRKVNPLKPTSDKTQNKEMKIESGFAAIAIFHPSTSRIGIISVYPETKFSEGEESFTELLNQKKHNQIKKRFAELLQIEVPFEIIADNEQLGKLVDMAGGIPFYINETDLLANEKLPAKEFILDGSQVNRLLYPEGESESISALRLFRNYSLMLNFWKERLTKWQIFKNLDFFGSAVGNFQSNLSDRELFYLAESLMSKEGWLPIFLELPVRRQKDYFIFDKDAAGVYLQNFFGQLKDKKNPFLEKPARMEIKNGTAVANLARKYRSKLTRKGIEVLEFTNAASNDYEETILIDVSTNSYYLRSIANILGVKKVYHSVNRSLFTDLVMILGNDHLDLKVEN